VRNVLNSHLSSALQCLPPPPSAEDAKAADEDAATGAENAPVDEVGFEARRPHGQMRRRGGKSHR
jgi:hypothetical protein